MAISTLVKGHGAYSAGRYDDPEIEFKVEFEGAVLATYERNGYDDSDFYAVVWDGEKIKDVQYATTRAWTYANGATVDATDEVKAAAGEWLARRQAESAAVLATAQAKVAVKGSLVKVVKGRKVPKGTTGEVFWVGPDRYQRSRYGTTYRVGLVTEDGTKHFTAMSNVEVIDPEVFTAEDFYKGPVTTFGRSLEGLAYSAVAVARAESLSEDGYASAR